MNLENRFELMPYYELMEECMRLEGMLDAEHKIVVELQNRLTELYKGSTTLRMPWGDWNS